MFVIGPKGHLCLKCPWIIETYWVLIKSNALFSIRTVGSHQLWQKGTSTRASTISKLAPPTGTTRVLEEGGQLY